MTAPLLGAPLVGGPLVGGPLLAQAAAAAPASPGRLIAAALIGIALLVVLITRYKVHPFLGLTLGSLVVAAIAGLPVTTKSWSIMETVISVVGLLLVMLLGLVV